MSLKNWRGLGHCPTGLTAPIWALGFAATMAVTLSAAHAQRVDQPLAAEADGHAAIIREQKPVVDHVPFARQIGVMNADIPMLAMPALDLGPILMEDEARLDAGGLLRVAYPRDTAVDTSTGAWFDAPGGHLWVLDVHGAGSLGARLHCTNLNLPPDAELWFYDPVSLDKFTGPLGGIGPLDNGEAWSKTVRGDIIRIEYFRPDSTGAFNPNAALPFDVVEVQHLYRDIFGQGAGPGGVAGGAGSCHNTPSCYAQWSDVADAVALVFFGGGFVCSGQLIATEIADETPYYTTAAHCISTQGTANTAEFIFRYERPSCAGGVSGGVSTTGSDLMATYSGSDNTLLRIRGEIPFGTFWVGWTTSVIPNGTASTCLHHPAGDYMRISFGTKITTTSFCGGGAGWHVASWNDGVTEGGSSGSGFFRNSDQKMYGVLTCGGSSCANPQFDDGYGRFDWAYQFGGFASHLEAGFDDAFEENDDCNSAAEIDDGSYPGLVVKSTDDDWYHVPLAAGGDLSVTALFADINGDIDLQLYDACGGAIVLVAVSNTNNEFLNYTNPGPDASFYLRVYLDTDTRNEYTLNLDYKSPGDVIENDNCSDALVISDGLHPFSNIGANTDGFPVLDCGNEQIDSDLWYSYTAPCTGTLTVGTCALADFDTIVAVSFQGACPPGIALACSDDVGGCPSGTSLIQMQVFQGVPYLIRVGGKDGATGSGQLVVGCVPDVVCPEDLDGNGSVDAADLAALLGSWGAGGPADLDGSGTVDAADLAQLLGAWGPC